MDIRTEISPSEVMKKEASTNAEAAQSAGLRKMPENPPVGSLEAVFYIPAAAKSAPDFHFFHRESRPFPVK